MEPQISLWTGNAIPAHYNKSKTCEAASAVPMSIVAVAFRLCLDIALRVSSITSYIVNNALNTFWWTGNLMLNVFFFFNRLFVLFGSRTQVFELLRENLYVCQPEIRFRSGHWTLAASEWNLLQSNPLHWKLGLQHRAEDPVNFATGLPPLLPCMDRRRVLPEMCKSNDFPTCCQKDSLTDLLLKFQHSWFWTSTKLIVSLQRRMTQLVLEPWIRAHRNWAGPLIWSSKAKISKSRWVSAAFKSPAAIFVTSEGASFSWNVWWWISPLWGISLWQAPQQVLLWMRFSQWSSIDFHFEFYWIPFGSILLFMDNQTQSWPKSNNTILTELFIPIQQIYVQTDINWWGIFEREVNQSISSIMHLNIAGSTKTEQA